MAARRWNAPLRDMRDRRRAGGDVERQEPIDKIARALGRAGKDRRLVGGIGIDASQDGGRIGIELRPRLFEKGEKIGHETILRGLLGNHALMREYDSHPIPA